MHQHTAFPMGAGFSSFFFSPRKLIKLSHNQMIEGCHPQQFWREIRFYWRGEWPNPTRTQGTNRCTPLVSGLCVLPSEKELTVRLLASPLIQWWTPTYLYLNFTPRSAFIHFIYLLLLRISGAAYTLSGLVWSMESLLLQKFWVKMSSLRVQRSAASCERPLQTFGAYSIRVNLATVMSPCLVWITRVKTEHIWQCSTQICCNFSSLNIASVPALSIPISECVVTCYLSASAACTDKGDFNSHSLDKEWSR